MAKKIAILGTSESSVKMSEGLDDSWEIWGCNAAYQFVSGYHKHFELHKIDYLKTLGMIAEYTEYMKFKAGDLILNQPHADFPQATIYPIDKVLKFFNIKYFNNTIAYMVALAIVENPDLEELALFGVDMAADTEYAHQRPCTEFYLGYAAARGVAILIPNICPILKSTHLYGIEDIPSHAMGIKSRLKEAKELSGKYSKERENAIINQAYCKGRMDELAILERLHT